MGKLDLKSKMPTLDDIFSTEEERHIDQQTTSRVREIPIANIDDFPDHPFQVRDDEDMAQLVESIQERGILTPALVREKEDGRFELISGHRRRHACTLAGLTTLKVEVVNLDRNEAVLVMVESNLQRTEIRPSEKAFAYKMKLDAMKRKGGRPSKINLSPAGTNLRSDQQLAQEMGESRNQIQRYIRLTELIPELLQYVDDGKIALRPAVELSYLKPDEQQWLYRLTEDMLATPSLAQAQKLKLYSGSDKLSENVIESILSEEKGNQVEKIKLPAANISKYLKNIPVAKQEEHICKALEYYQRHLQRNRER